MDERWREIERIYHTALEQDKDARAEFLGKACAGDQALRGQVEFLLAQDEQAGSFLESPAIEVVAESLAKEKQSSDPAKPALEPGTMVAHYRLTGKLGEGGMGEVYRARDTKLQRDVALKILPQAMAQDVQRMARFEREAQALASLNHPNIAAIYGLEESNGVRTLVMELVEGETLAEKIDAEHKAFPCPDALPIARQIAEALEYAHEHGVIHRDLKPANVKITPEGTVKVLDFGLAKVLSPQDSSSALDPASSPSLSTMATQPGILLGTAAYMSPEQAKGQRVDRRCDIWAFGCVLFEMLSGQKAFAGETISDVLVAVLTKEPDWDVLPETTPPSIQKLVRRCLVKEAKQRLRDIGDARIAIEETLGGNDTVAAVYDRRLSPEEGPGARRAPLQRALPWALALVMVGILGGFLIAFVAIHLLRPPETEQRPIQFPIQPPQNTQFGDFVLSPDGRKLAFVAWGPETKAEPELWVRPLDSLAAQPLRGTDGAQLPLWSPDGRNLGFFAQGKIKKIAVSGGPPQTLCEASGTGATWSRNGVIVFTDRGRLFRVPETGSTPTLVAAPDRARYEQAYRLPQFLPDGRHFLFLISSTSPSAGGAYSIGLGSLDSREVERLSVSSSNALYSPPGYLLYLDQATLMARPFDAGRLEFAGQAVPIAEGVGMVRWPGYGYFAVSQTGVLAYQTGANSNLSPMVWRNRKGQELGTLGQPDVYTNPALSPDGTKLAVGRGKVGERDIWIYDLKRGTASRLTFNPADDLDPVWSGDGSRILFTSTRRGQRDLYQKSANGLGSTEPLFVSKQQAKSLIDLSPDGRYAIYDTTQPPEELWVLPLSGERKPFGFIQGKFNVPHAQFSPNGRYIAYSSTETGRPEVYVQAFPQHQGKWPISTNGGMEPMWRQDGKELFYLTPDDRMMAVDVKADSGKLRAGEPRALFQVDLISGGLWRNRYVVSTDGQRFLMLVPAVEANPEPITVVVNWPALLKEP